MRMVVGMVVLLAAGLAAADEEPEAPLPEVAAALARIQDASTIELTTTGRRSGKEHTRPIWFVVSDGKILVQAGKDGKTDWYRNLEKNPSGVVRQREYAFRVRAKPIEDRDRIERIHRLFLDKYTTARVLSWVGSSLGQGRPLELTPVSVAIRRGM